MPPNCRTFVAICNGGAIFCKDSVKGRHHKISSLILNIGRLISLAVVAVAFALLSIKVLLKRNGKFSSQHVHDNPGLRKQGIHCVMDQDREARERNGAY